MRWTTTLEIWQVLFFVITTHLGNNTSLQQEFFYGCVWCGPETQQPQVQHNTKGTKTDVKANITKQYNNIYVII